MKIQFVPTPPELASVTDIVSRYLRESGETQSVLEIDPSLWTIVRNQMAESLKARGYNLSTTRLRDGRQGFLVMGIPVVSSAK